MRKEKLLKGANFLGANCLYCNSYLSSEHENYAIMHGKKPGDF